MLSEVKKPYVIYMAEIIYSYVSIEKNKYPNLDTKEAINKFMETKEFIKLSSGALHDEWFGELKKMHIWTKIQEVKYQKKPLDSWKYKRI